MKLITVPVGTGPVSSGSMMLLRNCLPLTANCICRFVLSMRISTSISLLSSCSGVKSLKAAKVVNLAPWVDWRFSSRPPLLNCRK